MILKTVKLENIRSYTSQSIDFPYGSVLLSGDIGTGKSTILLAIEFALFGIIRTELSGEHLLRHGKKEGSVELKFEIDGKEYIIKRGLKKQKENIVQDTGYLITDGKKFDGTPVELKSKIIGILGYPEELVAKSKSLIYRYTVYTPQEEMKQILFEDKEARLDTLRKLFGIDKYKAIKENAVIFVRELRRKQSELGIRLEPLPEYDAKKKEKEERFKALLNESKKLSDELNIINKKVLEQKGDFEEIEKKINVVNEAKRNFHVMEAKISGRISSKDVNEKRVKELNISLSETEHKLASYTDVLIEDDLEEELSKLITLSEQSALIEEELKEKRTDNQKEIAEKRDAIKSRLLELEKVTSKRTEYEKLLDEHNEKSTRARVFVENINFSIQESREKIKNILALEVCPICNQNVNDSHKEEIVNNENEKIKKSAEEKSKYDQAAKKISENIAKIKNNLENISKKEEKYNKEREEFIKIEENLLQIAQRQKEFSTLLGKKKKIDDFLGKRSIDRTGIKLVIETKKKQLAGLREKKALLEKAEQNKIHISSLQKETAEIDAEIAKLTIEKNKFEKTLKEFENVDKTHEELKSAYEEEKEKQKQLEIKTASFAQEKKSLEKDIIEIEAKLLLMKKIKDQLKELSSTEIWFDKFFMNLMSTMEKHIMISIHKEFEALLKGWLSMLIEEIDISLEEDFSVKIHQDGYVTDIESLSGGEKTSVALAYRLALNKVINDMISHIKTKDLIILDEPTDGFSSEQLDKVRDILNELAMKQTIIVSHESKMESYVENIIRVSKTENLSTVEKI